MLHDSACSACFTNNSKKNINEYGAPERGQEFPSAVVVIQTVNYVFMSMSSVATSHHRAQKISKCQSTV